jgi:hypothetical protein
MVQDSPMGLMREPIDRAAAMQTVRIGDLPKRLAGPAVATLPVTRVADDQPENKTLSALTISVIALVLIFGGTFAGAFLRNSLPSHHLSDESKDVVRLGSALVATIAALILSLLITSAKTSYDTHNARLAQMTADIVLLDRLLAGYGPGSHEARALLRHTADVVTRKIWKNSSDGNAPAPSEPADAIGRTYSEILDLAPQSESQKALRERAIQLITDVSQVGLTMSAHVGATIPIPLLAVLTAWLVIIFASFSLFSRLNSTTVVALFLFALSAAGAIFLVLEMDQPFAGLIRIPDNVLRDALPPLRP